MQGAQEDETSGSMVEESEFHQMAYAQSDHQAEGEVVEHLVFLMLIESDKIVVCLSHWSD